MNRDQPDPAPRAFDLSRRKLFRLFGAAAATAVAGLARGLREFGAIAQASAADLPACVVRPEQTEGPYFIDEKLNRSDIRLDPSDKSVKTGVPLRLEFHVSGIAGGNCMPLSGTIVDIWHCDALGVYSDVRDAGFDTRGKKFLRGYQQTDSKGAAQFFTIYPGWYAGRAVHIHFKIRSAAPSARHQAFTSQLYFDEAVTDQIFKQAPYNGKDGRRTMNDGDSIFRRDGRQLLLTPTKNGQDYAAKFEIGLQLA
jgi:protocatechuate 3,4-dioxygenase beta subunit